MAKEKEYMNLDEAAEILGIKRATLYKYMDKLEMKPVKFKLDRRTYLSQEQVKRLKEILEKPWLAGKDEKRKDEKRSEEKPDSPAA